MDQEYIAALQQRIESYFKQLTVLPLDVVTADCCSEMARLVGVWIVHDFPTAEINILKGSNVTVGKNPAHELLAVRLGGKSYAIDPTIWQMNPGAKSVFIGVYPDTHPLIADLQKRYGGTWQISEVMKNTAKIQRQELEQTLQDLIRETDAGNF